MKIVVNTRLLLKDRLEGIGWFTYENLKRITTNHPEHEFIFLFDRPYSDDFLFSDNITPIILFPQARHPFLYYWWFQYSVKSILKRLKPDLFLSTDGYIPLDSGTRTLNVFHDLNFEHYPNDVPFLERWYYKRFFPKFARESNRIATVSNFSKLDIIKQYHIDPDKIDVVYNGANESFHKLDNMAQEKVRNRVTGGTPYFFFIGSLHPRKNLTNLFKAFDMFRASTDTPVKLVIAGVKKWWTTEIQSVYNSLLHKSDIVFIGHLKSRDVNDIMASALALTYVSYFEGFGIPIVEAFKCGVPVITSNVTSMPEIAGDAALLTDPFKPESIAKAMKDVVVNDQLRNQLIESGFRRAAEFTWDKSAQRLWASIEKTVNA